MNIKKHMNKIIMGCAGVIIIAGAVYGYMYYPHCHQRTGTKEECSELQQKRTYYQTRQFSEDQFQDHLMNADQINRILDKEYRLDCFIINEDRESGENIENIENIER